MAHEPLPAADALRDDLDPYLRKLDGWSQLLIHLADSPHAIDRPALSVIADGFAETVREMLRAFSLPGQAGA